MTNPIWINDSNLGRYYSYVPISIQLIANAILPATTVTYSLISGLLPNGLVLTSSGYIQGTISNVNSNVNSTLTLIIRATDNLGNFTNKTFTIQFYNRLTPPTWVTPSGSLGSFPSLNPLVVQLSANPSLPAVNVVYTLLSGSLPPGVTMNEDGLITGTPTLVTQEVTSTFAVRATDNYQNIRDRTFSISISGSAIPSFTTPAGNLLTTWDSLWISLPLTYTNPDPTNPVTVKLTQGSLPPGLEINEYGLIRGYPEKPIVNVTLPNVITTATVTETTNIITCLSTSGFTVGRPVVFTGVSVFGGIVEGVTYYVKSIISTGGGFTISATQNGPTLNLTSGTGFMTVTLPPISVGQPTIRTFSFTLQLQSPLGGDSESYSITVINQNTPISQGGPGRSVDTRIPTILNTRPLSYNIDNEYFGYYLLPPDSEITGETYPLSALASMGTFQSNNYFAFKIIGYDFDGNPLQYSFSGLPLGLIGDVNTGWITGTPVLSSQSINQYTFQVAVNKTSDPTIQSPFISFVMNVAFNVDETIIWITDSNLGVIFNGTISTKSVSATSEVDLSYRLVSGSLPPNLTLLNNGQITGYVANQPTSQILTQGAETDFNFAIEAYSELYPIIKSTKNFNITVLQEYNQPTDILYIKCTPSIPDRIFIDSLLTNESLIPNSYLYRPDDVYFGKANSVIYEHAYGIYASSIDQYIAAITQNHYWRNITLGEIKTAVAKDETGTVIYEVVYSEVIDNLVNPEGVSISEEVIWPRPIDLNLGPWYTSVTNIYTSYANILGQDYYTSLTSGFARLLYPNSLYNMRTRVAQNLGQEFDSRLLPQWMTSQQANGSTLGFTQAWVICYTKPGFAQTVKNNIDSNWIDPATGEINKLNRINFQIDRFSVDKSITYNYDNNTSPPAWTGLPSATPVPNPLDSKDFYVLFPRKTILPDENQL